jgi:hypothetical protein
MAASFLVLHMSSSCAGASSLALRSQTHGASTPAAPVPSDHLHLQVQLSATSKLRQSTPGAFLWHGSRAGITAVAATSRAFDSFEDPASGPGMFASPPCPPLCSLFSFDIWSIIQPTA